MLLGRAVGAQPPRNWIDGALLLWGAVAVGCLLLRRLPRAEERRLFLRTALCFGLCGLVAFRFAWPVGLPGFNSVAWAMELKPLLYVLAAVGGMAAFGVPSAARFRKCGAGLALLVLAEFCVTWFLTGQVERPVGSGEINYDGMLMVICLCFGLGREHRGFLRLMALGILVTFSRTSVLAATGVLICFGPYGVVRKVCLLFLGLAGVWLSFQVRGLLGALEALDRFWMWHTAGEFVLSAPWQAVAGFWPGSELPFGVPAPLSFLWSAQARQWGLAGVHPFNLHAFWLRMGATWGLIAAGLLAAGLLAAVLAAGAAGWLLCVPSRGMGRAGRALRALCLLCLVGGLTMGLVYCNNLGVVLISAFFAARRFSLREPRFRGRYLQMSLNVIQEDYAR